MDMLTVIFLSFCVCHCYGQNKQRKLTRLQLDVDSLRALTVELKLDIDGLQSWRNATLSSPCETGLIDSDNECSDYQLRGSFEQSMDVMEGQVSYIIKGLEGEKIALRKIMDYFRAEVRQDIAMLQVSVSSAVNETKFKEAKNETEKALRRIETNQNQQMLTLESKDAKINAKLNQLILSTESKCADIDSKLNQHLLTIESKDAEITEQFNRISKQLETSIGDAFGQLKDLSNRLDRATKANGDMLEQVNHLSKQMIKTVQDNPDNMKHLAKQLFISLKQDGWLQYDNCLYKLFTPGADFAKAVKNCEDNGASLAEITDMAELQFLADNFDIHYLWLGATDHKTEGEWRWLSGQLVMDGNWYPGQPDNLVGRQHCLMTGRTYQFKYRDNYCYVKTPYVCKIQ